MSLLVWLRLKAEDNSVCILDKRLKAVTVVFILGVVQSPLGRTR